VGEEDSDDLRKDKNSIVLARVSALLEAVECNAEDEQIFEWIDRGNGEPTETFFTLDPIDGTKGFIGGRQYAIALALIENGRPVVGILGLPNYRYDDDYGDGAILYASRGEGAFISPIADISVRRCLKVSSKADTSEMRLVESYEKSSTRHELSAKLVDSLGIINDPLRIDSQAKYAAVATGDADIYFRMTPTPDYREKIWDHAAGVVIVEEAGGKVTDTDGKPLDFTKGKKLMDNVGILVTNGRIHDRVVDAIATAK
jgi:3'(2'), 5'-bisphosphate nucleotidase